MATLGCALTVLAVLALLLRTLLRPRAFRINPPVRDLRAFGLCLAAALVLAAPAAGRLLRGLPPFPGLDVLLGDELRLLALYFLAQLAESIRTGEPRRSRRPLAVILALLGASALLFALAQGPGAEEGSYPGTAARAAMAGYDLVFLAYGEWSVSVFLLGMVRHAAGLEPGPLRTALRLYSASAAVGLVWSAWTVSDIVAVLGTGRQGTNEDLPSAALGALCLALILCGTMAALCARYVTALRRRWLAYRAYLRLGPLWEELHRALPGIALSRPGRIRRLLPRDVQFARYRRVIEIHDAHLALRPHFPPPVEEWAPAGTGRRTGPPAATVEAVNLAVAIEAASHGFRFTRAAPAPPGRRPRQDLDAETAWLVAVAEDFARSAAVARVRHQVRHHLADGAGTAGREGGAAVGSPRAGRPRAEGAPVRAHDGRPAEAAAPWTSDSGSPTAH
ncbi:MAB_1171c family putative transporter [Streptomyces sp. NPDC059070]|uniref:MAB_1171c family putative transporter n=1 Tax=Streptomyces sp. NPDC059070 TaxID=3346713 RepID=UPI0036C6231E